jgi:hypothetical protein
MEHTPAALPATGGGGWLGALQTSPIGVAMRESLWLYPVVEVVHIIGFALLVGAIVAFDLRLMGVRGASLPADVLSRLLLPLSVTGFLLAAPSGALLFTAEATAYVRNPAFLLKLVLIGLALLNILLFHSLIGRRMAGWSAVTPPPLAARIAGVASLALWIGALAAGRLIAYV